MLKTNLAGLKLENPTILASGFLGISPEVLQRVGDSGAGALTMKTLCVEAQEGHRNPTVVGWEAGMLNAVGLSGHGVKNVEWSEIEKLKVPVIVSIAGNDVSEFEKAVKFVSGKKIAAIELNLSCPNKENGMAFSLECKPAEGVVRACKKHAGKLPVFAKLTPQANDIAAVAKACEKAGADGITAINTLGPGMIIDINSGKPILAYKRGGLSGPAIRPVAVRCVYDIYKAVKIPIIGTGGITTGRDAIEMIMAGATALGVGTAIYYRGLDVFRDICMEMEAWMKQHKYKSLGEIRGVAHE